MFGCYSSIVVPFIVYIKLLFYNVFRFKNWKNAAFMYQFLDRFCYVYFRISTYWCGYAKPNSNCVTVPLALQRELSSILNNNYMDHFNCLKQAVLQCEFLVLIHFSEIQYN